MSQQEVLNPPNDLIASQEAYTRVDCSYIEVLFQRSQEEYQRFADFAALAARPGKADPRHVALASLIVMQHEDCGACLQICVNLAKDAGLTDAETFSLDDPIPVLPNLPCSGQLGLGIRYGEEIMFILKVRTFTFTWTTLGTSINDSSFFGERPFT